MGRNEKRERVSRMRVLLAYLLKWKYQTVRRFRSWKNAKLTQRMDIMALLEDSLPVFIQ